MINEAPKTRAMKRDDDPFASADCTGAICDDIDHIIK